MREGEEEEDGKRTEEDVGRRREDRGGGGGGGVEEKNNITAVVVIRQRRWITLTYVRRDERAEHRYNDTYTQARVRSRCYGSRRTGQRTGPAALNRRRRTDAKTAVADRWPIAVCAQRLCRRAGRENSPLKWGGGPISSRPDRFRRVVIDTTENVVENNRGKEKIPSTSEWNC